MESLNLLLLVLVVGYLISIVLPPTPSQQVVAQAAKDARAWREKAQALEQDNAALRQRLATYESAAKTGFRLTGENTRHAPNRS